MRRLSVYSLRSLSHSQSPLFGRLNKALADKMKIRDKIYKRYYQLAKSYLRTSDIEADTFASAISNNHSLLGGFCHFCLSPQARSVDVNAAIIKRWLSSVTELLEIASIINIKAIEPGSVQSMGELAIKNIYDVTTTIGISYCHLDTSEASELANCLSRSASPAFAYYQTCMSPEHHTLKSHAAMLKTFINCCLIYAAAANVLFFKNNVG